MKNSLAFWVLSVFMANSAMASFDAHHGNEEKKAADENTITEEERDNCDCALLLKELREIKKSLAALIKPHEPSLFAGDGGGHGGGH
jgi:hypothetical protein